MGFFNNRAIEDLLMLWPQKKKREKKRILADSIKADNVNHTEVEWQWNDNPKIKTHKSYTSITKIIIS